MNYDVVIVGAGPGGVAAAHNLINNNISCILIDKQKFPRNKLCAGGITRKLVDEKFNANGFCLQVEIDKDKFNYEGNYMSLYYGIIPQGYGWIFPKKNSFTVGFGGNYDKNIDYHKEFEEFLNNLGINCHIKSKN